jgi:chorismate dehydratase
MNNLRIGRIPYLVCAPYFFKNPTNHIDFIEGSPALLNEYLQDGSIDAAPSSSVEYALHSQRYYIFRDITTGSHNRIKSVLLFSKYPWEELNNKTIKLSPDSNTSNILLKILCKRKHQIRVNYEKRTENYGDAELVIGNQSLLRLYHEVHPYVYDLAEEWYRWQNLPFSFGLWMINKKSWEEKEDQLVSYFNFLKDNLEEFFFNFDESLQSFLKVNPLPLPFHFIQAFFDRNNYEFSHNHQKSLLLFYRLAWEEGLLPPCEHLEWLPQVHSV